MRVAKIPATPPATLIADSMRKIIVVRVDCCEIPISLIDPSPRTVSTAIAGNTVGTAVNFQQTARSFDFPRVLLPGNGIGLYLLQIPGCDKLVERISWPLVVKRELADLATEHE